MDEKKQEPISPMCDAKEMIKAGWSGSIPYIIWPQELIDMVIDGIKKRENIDIHVCLREGFMSISKEQASAIGEASNKLNQ